MQNHARKKHDSKQNYFFPHNTVNFISYCQQNKNMGKASSWSIQSRNHKYYFSKFYDTNEDLFEECLVESREN